MPKVTLQGQSPGWTPGLLFVSCSYTVWLPKGQLLCEQKINSRVSSRKNVAKPWVERIHWVPWHICMFYVALECILCF